MPWIPGTFRAWGSGSPVSGVGDLASSLGRKDLIRQGTWINNFLEMKFTTQHVIYQQYKRTRVVKFIARKCWSDFVFIYNRRSNVFFDAPTACSSVVGNPA